MADPLKTGSLAVAFLWMVCQGAGCQDQQSFPPALNPMVAAVSDQLPLDPCLDFSDAARSIRNMLDAVNSERHKSKLRPLKLDPTLMQIAEFYACRLVDGRFFSHVDPYDGSKVDTRAADFGYTFLKIGQNLAAEQRSVAEAMAALLDSPGHRSNILDPAYTEMGIAVKGGGEYGIYWVQEFGRPLSAGPMPPSSASSGLTGKPTSQPTPTGRPSLGGDGDGL